MPALFIPRAIAALMFVSLASACNTMSGVGQDITGTSRFLQVYMPPELQGTASGVAAAAPMARTPAYVPTALGGVPPLDGL